MGPVEGFYLTIAGIVLLIGLGRGYKKELGNTLVFIGAVLIFAALYEVAWEQMVSVTGAILSDESAGYFPERYTLDHLCVHCLCQLLGTDA